VSGVPQAATHRLTRARTVERVIASYGLDTGHGAKARKCGHQIAHVNPATRLNRR